MSSALHLYSKRLYFIFDLFLLYHGKHSMYHNQLGTNQLTSYSQVESYGWDTIQLFQSMQLFANCQSE